MSVTRFALAAAFAIATISPVLALTPQQEKMKTCNADASGQKLAGSARKSFVSSCLKGDATAPAEKPLTAQQTKMKTCNTDASAKSLKGKDRRAFMSTCLKG